MLKFFTRKLISAILLLVAFAAPSALAAGRSHGAIFHATHRHGVHVRSHRHHRSRLHRKRGRGSRKKPAASQLRTLASTSTTVLLGESSIESHVDYVSGGQAEAFRFQATSSATAGTMHVYLDSRNAARTLIVGLYASSGAHPGSLLSTGSISNVQAGTWDSVLLTPTSLVAGKSYWLAVLGESGALRYRDRNNGPCPSETSAQTTLGGLPATWKTGKVYATCPVSAYVTPALLIFEPPVSVEPVSTEPVSKEPTPVPPSEPTPLPPPPPSAPSNTAPPTVSGAAQVGQSLVAGSGSWSGTTPIGYAYQWQDCNTTGEACANIPGAASTEYAPSDADVGHTVRVVVTASNRVGSTAATSAGAGPVSVLPPTASFTYTPITPIAGQPVRFDGSSSICPDGPCTYTWSDDGSTTRPTVPLWPLGSGQILQFTFSGAATKYVRLVVTDATGQTATVEHNIVVQASAPPPPVPPSNTELPAVSGTAQVGQMLIVNSGAWAGSAPINYSYQWQDCNASGEGCASIGGATGPLYTVTEADIGHTILVVVTASNAGGSTLVTSQATTVVVAASPFAPVNTALPVVSGSAKVGQTVTASDGAWGGTAPIGYAYQWVDCDASGQGCGNIGGATGPSYTLVSGDIGHTVRVVVTAGNVSGSKSATSEPTETIVEGEAFTCSQEVHPSEEAAKIGKTIAEATAGQTICFASGTYPKIEMLGGKGEVKGSKSETENGRTGYVTVRPANSANVTVQGFTVRNSGYERFEHFTLTGGILFYDALSYAGSSHYQVLYDTFDEPPFGVDVRGPESGGGLIRDVTVEHDYMHKVTLESYGKEGKTGECKAGATTGQDVTVSNGAGIVVKHNTFFEAQWHYIQGGSYGPEGMYVEDNLFAGIDPYECTHLNVWQIFVGGENDYFNKNIVVGRGTSRGAGPFKNGTELASTDILEFENGGGSKECGFKIKNTFVENNLLVDAGGNSQMWSMEGATTKNNTIVNLEYYFATGLGSVAEGHCGPSTTLTVTHNIAATAGPLSMGEFSQSGIFDYNVTSGASANSNGSTHYVTGWGPKWQTTTWPVFKELEAGVHFPTPPAGYYIPEGLPFEAGYQGGVGP